MSGVTEKARIASFGGKLLKLSHNATTTRCEMSFNLYLPPGGVEETKKGTIPVLIYLSGLTCTAENCSEKGFFQHGASKKGIAVLYPDTSPRGLNIEGENDAYDFGSGAGFYVDATKAPYNAGYNMYSYITEELPQVVFSAFPQLNASNVSITGHSMGGHGALTLFLRNPGKYKSVSAFAPITNPINCPWGQKAFKGYFGDDQQEKWKEHDATELIKKWGGEPLDILIDVGTGDNFYKQGQLLPENFQAAATAGGHSGVKIRYQPDYDHSYYTMASFADDHIEHAAKALFKN
ncbi:S-formylglutathione hydrolase [Penicillium macrosclerotiorum]|uniref:S-formylglutathione hydrolase n=1 Tax=Penicillium macrosclerotiorum TaxID=303699 RepID=UPI002549136B|nr:S-formylglutathione hydrolase [Penicillium macrosclerotiorum]KAJ5698311.1 S-formylglutathione hydrolase [Penicillium macrosclerotiorum]